MPDQYCVLVVDDDRLLRQFMVSLIADGGYRTLQAQDGAEAIQVAERSRIDLLITDIEMPGISGLELIRVLRDRGLVDRSLVVTGYSGYSSAPISSSAVPIPCLSKPFTPQQLLANVRELLGSSVQRRMNDEEINAS